MDPQRRYEAGSVINGICLDFLHEIWYTSITHMKYLTVSVRMLFRECRCKNAGVAGYAEDFTPVLSGKQASET